MYISNVQWRWVHSRWPAVWVAWGCYRGCPDCTIARVSGWVALSILRDKHSSGGSRVWPGGFVAGCRARWAVTASSSFVYDFILIYLKSRVIHAYRCTNPVDLPWRTGVGPMLQASGRFRPGCDVLRHTHWDKEANDVTLWTALVTWYFWRHFMLVVVSALAAN